jgi:hypothetical protein
MPSNAPPPATLTRPVIGLGVAVWLVQRRETSARVSGPGTA